MKFKAQKKLIELLILVVDILVVCQLDVLAVNSFRMNQYVRNDSIPNQMYLFIGVNESKKEKYVVVDANNNHDFSDDHLYTFSLPDEPLEPEEKKSRAVGLQVTPDPRKNDRVDIGIDVFNYFQYRYGLKQDERLEVIVVFPEYMYVQTQIENIPVEISGDLPVNLFKRVLDQKSDFTIAYNDKANQPTRNSFRLSDTIHIHDKLYKLIKIEHPDIHLKELSVLADSSSVGSFVPLVYARNLDEDYPVSINDLIKGKYIFIDFWGSWCGPCIGSIPKLKNFYEEIKDRPDVLMLGIAAERDREGVEKLKGIIADKEIEWLNLWLSNRESGFSTSIFKKLAIRSYPTYLIIDNTGKIVYKKHNSKHTQEAIDFFIELLAE